MKAQLVGHRTHIAQDLPEMDLLLAVIKRAHMDAAYTPKPGVKQRSVSPEEQKSAQSFLRDWRQAVGTHGATKATT